MGNLRESFLKSTGLTFDPEKLLNNVSEEKKAELFNKISWQIGKGKVLDNPKSVKAQVYAETITNVATNLNLTDDLDGDGVISATEQKIINEIVKANEIKSSISIETDEPEIIVSLIDVLTNGGEYTLTEDYKVDKTLVPAADVVINLNGFKIYNDTDIWKGNDWSLFSVRSANTLTINGPGELITKENDCYCCDVKNENGKLVINGDVTCLGNITTVYAEYGKIEINGGHYDIQQKTDLKNVTPNNTLINCLDASYKAGTASIEVTGGEYVDFNPAMNKAEIASGTSFVKEGYKVQVNGEDNTDFYNESLGTNIIYKVVKK